MNRGIAAAHQSGILTATTLMATGAQFDDAVRVARELPQLDVGVHLVLVGSPGLPDSLPQLTVALAQKRIHPYQVLSGQMRRILDAGILPTHLDTHKHTHLLPPVLEAVARIGEEFGIPWVRRPFDLPISGGGAGWGRRMVSRSFGLLRRRFHRVLSAHGCRTTDHFAGFQITGNYDGAELASLIKKLPDGVTEFMCHPGFCTDELRAERTRLKESRQKELEALVNPEVRQALREANCQLVSYAGMDCRLAQF